MAKMSRWTLMIPTDGCWARREDMSDIMTGHQLEHFINSREEFVKLIKKYVKNIGGSFLADEAYFVITQALINMYLEDEENIGEEYYDIRSLYTNA